MAITLHAPAPTPSRSGASAASCLAISALLPVCDPYSTSGRGRRLVVDDAAAGSWRWRCCCCCCWAAARMRARTAAPPER
eukprot:scaffold6717_cov255-Prasinococcus_capsulatus_cf.AAC.1